MQPAIHVESLSKRYVLGVRQRGEYRTLREALTSAALLPINRLRHAIAPKPDDTGADPSTFYALKDVTLDVNEGEVVGIVGRNGAGKSTLLKILSRITEPTSGRIVMRGRLASLLEVGTGFHPELTGRENIYLNGSILGMKRREIARKFDEIVAFSEIEKFLDTPVKRYSSGMYVRLAFAVAAHLEPEVLVVDEVLAVGDVAFQRKCLGRMQEVSRNGRTVLFVSHNMAAVEALCTHAILLDHGQVLQTGAVKDVVKDYYRLLEADQLTTTNLADQNGAGRSRRVFQHATLLDETGRQVSYLPLGSAFHLRIAMQLDRAVENPVIAIGMDDGIGQRVLTLQTPVSRASVAKLEGWCEVDCRVDQFPLAPGEYWIKLAATAHGVEVDTVERALRFSVLDGDAFEDGRGFYRGVCVAPSEWSVQRRASTPCN